MQQTWSVKSSRVFGLQWPSQRRLLSNMSSHQRCIYAGAEGGNAIHVHGGDDCVHKHNSSCSVASCTNPETQILRFRDMATMLLCGFIKQINYNYYTAISTNDTCRLGNSRWVLSNTAILLCQSVCIYLVRVCHASMNFH